MKETVGITQRLSDAQDSSRVEPHRLEQLQQDAQSQIKQLQLLPVPGEGSSARLDATIRQARDLLTRWNITSVAWLQGAQEIMDFWNDDLELAQATLNRNKKESWGEWQEKALSGGARAMHRLTKLK
eukprot:8915184-Pyramimonas_sp.AAC.1